MLLLIAVSTMVVYSIMYANGTLIKTGTMVASKEQFAIIQGNISALVLNPNAWQATKVANSSVAAGGTNAYAGNMDCLTNGTSCTNNGQPVPAGTPITRQPFALVDGVNPTAYYDGTVASNGVTSLGSFCNTYTNGAPTDNCVFTYQLVWSAECSATSNPNCTSPTVWVEAIFTYNPNSPLNIVLNTTQFSYVSNIGGQSIGTQIITH